MEELRLRLEKIADLINQKEDEISLLKEDLEAIRLALTVEDNSRTEETSIEPMDQKDMENSTSDESNRDAVEVESIQDVEHTEEDDPELQEPTLQAIDAMSQELDVQGASQNEKFGETTTIGDQANSSRLTNLKTAIGLNERFLFANELFNGDVQALGRAVEELNHVESSDAERLLNEEFAPLYKWDKESPTVIKFKSLVARRFL